MKHVSLYSWSFLVWMLQCWFCRLYLPFSFYLVHWAPTRLISLFLSISAIYRSHFIALIVRHDFNSLSLCVYMGWHSIIVWVRVNARVRVHKHILASIPTIALHKHQFPKYTSTEMDHSLIYLI